MRHGLVELSFKVHRGFVTESAVEPLAVVKDFDPLEDGCAGLVPRGKLVAMNQFPFQSAPEAFHEGVVVAVAAVGSCWGRTPAWAKPLPVGGTGVLDALVRVMYQSGGAAAGASAPCQRRPVTAWWPVCPPSPSRCNAGCNDPKPRPHTGSLRRF